jgi:predicted metal-binding membrane protein
MAYAMSLIKDLERVVSGRNSAPAVVEARGDPVFLGASALIFVLGAALTAVWCVSMSAMGGMPMPGGWQMSMVWMRMPGQTWPRFAGSFVGMWSLMMVPMMLPCLVPMLLRYRQAVAGADKLGRLTAVVGLGYFSVWTLFGVALFPLGVGLAMLEMQQPALARAVPATVGVVVVIAGALQLSAWKARYLACCRAAPVRAARRNSEFAWRHGVRLGLLCGACCANLMAIFPVIGIMDLRVMALVTAALTVERFTPSGERAARAIGVAVMGTGVLLIARAAGVG